MHPDTMRTLEAEDRSRAIDAQAKNARITDLEAALREIARMKPEPIGDTGFSQGPTVLFKACQRIARKALAPRREREKRKGE